MQWVGCCGILVDLVLCENAKMWRLLLFPNIVLIIIPGRYLHCCHRDHKVIARVHSVQLVNVEQCQAAVDPQTKPPDLGCESACSAAIVYNHHRHLLLLLSPKADTHLPSNRRRLSWPRHCRKVHTACAQGCKSQWFYDKHNCPQHDSIPGPHALQSDMLPLDHCNLQCTAALFSKISS